MPQRMEEKLKALIHAGSERDKDKSGQGVKGELGWQERGSREREEDSESGEEGTGPKRKKNLSGQIETKRPLERKERRVREREGGGREGMNLGSTSSTCDLANREEGISLRAICCHEVIAALRTGEGE